MALKRVAIALAILFTAALAQAGMTLLWRMSGAQIAKSAVVFPSLDPDVRIESPR